MGNFMLKKDRNYGKNQAPNGQYRATIKQCKAVGTRIIYEEEATVVDIKFEIKGGILLPDRYFVKGSIQSHTKFAYLIEAALGEVPSELDLDDLIGCEVMIEVLNEVKGSTKYCNIKKVMPVSETDSDFVTDDDELDSDSENDDPDIDLEDEVLELDDDSEAESAEDEDEEQVPRHRRSTRSFRG